MEIKTRLQQFLLGVAMFFLVSPVLTTVLLRFNPFLAWRYTFLHMILASVLWVGIIVINCLESGVEK